MEACTTNIFQYFMSYGVEKLKYDCLMGEMEFVRKFLMVMA